MTTAISAPMSSLPSLAVPNERFMTLSDGRTLAYTCGGAASSTRIAILLHGVFGVGEMSAHADNLWRGLGWRAVAPTLPGWGKSSPFPSGHRVCDYAADVQELLRGILEGGIPSHIVVFGGSYGSIFAYAVAANSPTSPKEAISGPIRGLVIAGGFSPYSDDAGYAAACDGMTWMNWLTVGRPGRSILLRWLHPLVGSVIRGKILSGGTDAALGLLRQILTGPSAMTPQEHAAVASWAAEHGTTFEDWEGGMARNMALSVRDTLDGFAATPEVINSNWGFDLRSIRVAGAGSDAATSLPLQIADAAAIPPTLPPVVIIGATRDHLAPIAMQRFVASRIPGGQLIELQGNHISAITLLFPLLAAVIRGVEAADAA